VNHGAIHSEASRIQHSHIVQGVAEFGVTACCREQWERASDNRWSILDLYYIRKHHMKLVGVVCLLFWMLAAQV
jgi:hypothetical protein